jgi:hypothetical protein
LEHAPIENGQIVQLPGHWAKEADMRIGFTSAFTTAAAREIVDRSEVQRRLLLCLFGLGTNMGMKRIGIGNDLTYKELLHTRDNCGGAPPLDSMVNFLRNDFDVHNVDASKASAAAKV